MLEALNKEIAKFARAFRIVLAGNSAVKWI